MRRKQPAAHTQWWSWEDNPDWSSHTPPAEPFLESACHDRSHFITIRCGRCGFDMHLHESQLAIVPPTSGVATACKGCGESLVFEPGYLPNCFADLRRRGWIA